MSEDTNCIPNIQILELFEKKELGQVLSKTEITQVYQYTLNLAFLQSYGNVNNTEDVEGVAEFFRYFCNKYNNYSSLPGEVNLSFDVAYFSDPTSFMGAAYTASNCSDEFGSQ
jgi:hypothetical protein